MSTENTENFETKKDYVQSLHRGMLVLEAFTSSNPSLSVTEVAEITHLSRPTARRLLLTLEYLGYVTSINNTFSLSSKVLSLSNHFLGTQQNIWDLAIPFMQKFADTTGESCSISILEDDQIIYVARVSKKRIMSINLQVGTRLPATATSMGHVLLAYQDETKLKMILESTELTAFTEHTITDKDIMYEQLMLIKKRGWAGVDQQFELGVSSIAVPIFGINGNVIAAINCSVHAGRVSKKTLREEFLSLLKQTAHKIGQIIPF